MLRGWVCFSMCEIGKEVDAEFVSLRVAEKRNWTRRSLKEIIARFYTTH